MLLDDQRTELERVLNSPQFRRAQKLKQFLNVTCNYHFRNQSQEITEFLIAAEAFGKGSDFDPSQDSLVRVQAREVRRRLKEYYQNEGKDSRIVLDFPVGQYAPVFTLKDALQPVPEAEALAPVLPPPAQPLYFKRFGLALTATAILGGLLMFAFDRVTGMSHSASAKATDSLTPRVKSLWDRFLTSDVPTLLVLSNPDTETCPDPKDPAQAASGVSGCAGQYTGMGEAVALHLITNLFKNANKPLTVKQSRMVTADDINHYNMILLGGRSVNVWTGRLAADISLASASAELASSPESKEASDHYQTVFDTKTGQVLKDRAVVAMRRHVSTGHWVLVLYGKYSQGTHAAAEALVDERFLSQLNWPDARKPFPEAFRLMVAVNVNDGIPQGPMPVAVRVP